MMLAYHNDPVVKAKHLLDSIFDRPDSSLIGGRFSIWLLSDEKWGVRKFASGDVLAAIDGIVDLHRRTIAGEAVHDEEWAAAAAEAAAAGAAAEAEETTATTAAALAALSAETTATTAATWAAVWTAAAAWTAWTSVETIGMFGVACADELERLLSEAPQIGNVQTPPEGGAA